MTYTYTSILQDKFVWFWAGILGLLTAALLLAGCAFDKLRLSVDKGSLQAPKSMAQPTIAD